MCVDVLFHGYQLRPATALKQKKENESGVPVRVCAAQLTMKHSRFRFHFRLHGRKNILNRIQIWRISTESTVLKYKTWSLELLRWSKCVQQLMMTTRIEWFHREREKTIKTSVHRCSNRRRTKHIFAFNQRFGNVWDECSRIGIFQLPTQQTQQHAEFPIIISKINVWLLGINRVINYIIGIISF